MCPSDSVRCMGVANAHTTVQSNVHPIDEGQHLLGALTKLAATTLEATHALLLPLPTHLGGRLLPRVGLVGASTTQAEHQVEGRLLLDVVILEGAAILELLAGEDKTLLVRGDALLVLDLGLHGLDGVSALDLEGDSLPRQCLDEDLHLEHLLGMRAPETPM